METKAMPKNRTQEERLDKLLEMQEVIDKNGFVEGTIHRYLIVAKKKG